MSLRRALSALPKEVKTAAAVFVIGLSFFYLGSSIVRGLQQVDWTELQPRPVPLAFSLLLYMLSNLIGAWCWALIVVSLGQKLPLRTNARIHFRANIVKYLPGYGWQILGKAYLCRQQGLPGGPIGLGIALEFFCVVLTGLWVALLTLPEAWLGLWGLVWLSPWRWPCVAALTALLLALPRLLHYGLGRFAARPADGQPVVIRALPLGGMLLAMIAAWFILGAALYSLIAALSPLPLADLPSLTFCWSISSIFSLAVVFVPMGIGVKEGFLAMLLGAHLPAALAAIIAVLARVISVISEALCFVLAERL